MDESRRTFLKLMAASGLAAVSPHFLSCNFLTMKKKQPNFITLPSLLQDWPCHRPGNRSLFKGPKPWPKSATKITQVCCNRAISFQRAILAPANLCRKLIIPASDRLPVSYPVLKYTNERLTFSNPSACGFNATWPQRE